MRDDEQGFRAHISNMPADGFKSYHTFDTAFSHDTTTNWTSASYLSKTTSPIPGDLILKSGHVMIYLGKTASGKIAVFEAVADGENGYSGSRYYEHDSVSGYSYYKYSKIGK